MSVSAEMKYIGTIDGKKVYWAEPGEFENPGVYYWDGENNVHVPMKPAIAEDTLGETGETNRGFSILEFTDRNGIRCTMQTSSACDYSHCEGLSEEEAENCYGRPMLWLGVHDVEPTIMAYDAIRLGLPTGGQHTGWVDYKIPKEVLLSSRMHLTVPKVKGLVADLQRWLRDEAGEE